MLKAAEEFFRNFITQKLNIKRTYVFDIVRGNFGDIVRGVT